MNQDPGFVCELKFVLDSETATRVENWSRTELNADPLAGTGTDSYRLASLYFDTEDFDTFFRRGSYARAKFRIRNYNGSSRIYFERKMKARNRVLKRRSEARIDDLSLLSEHDAPGSSRWFAQRLQYRRLRPVCQISYLRTARVGMSSSGPLRLTIDRQIRAIPVASIAFTRSPGLDILPGKTILELKYHSHMPVLFKHLVETFRLSPCPISKYRLSGQTLDFNGTQEGVECLSF